MATGVGGPSGEFYDIYYQYIRINFSQVEARIKKLLRTFGFGHLIVVRRVGGV